MQTKAHHQTRNSAHLTFVRRTVPTYAMYRCSCGNVCEKRIDHVNSGNTISCGHLRPSNRGRFLGIVEA